LAVEEHQTEVRYGNDTGLTSVTVSGTISGLDDTGGGYARRWANAEARAAGMTPGWALVKAQAEVPVPLHPNPLSTTVARNKTTGVITYSAQFDNRPAPADPNILSHITTVEIQNAADVFASIPVPFRAPGPLLQPMGTVTQKSITIRTDVVVRATYGIPPAWPVINHLAKALSYIGTPTQLFVANDSPSFVEESGRYSRTTTYVFQ
jgi:hypothetical protein